MWQKGKNELRAIWSAGRPGSDVVLHMSRIEFTELSSCEQVRLLNKFGSAHWMDRLSCSSRLANLCLQSDRLSLALKIGTHSVSSCSLRGRLKKGRGRGKGKGEKLRPPFFFSSQSPTLFDACNVGYQVAAARRSTDNSMSSLCHPTPISLS